MEATPGAATPEVAIREAATPGVAILAGAPVEATPEVAPAAAPVGTTIATGNVQGAPFGHVAVRGRLQSALLREV